MGDEIATMEGSKVNPHLHREAKRAVWVDRLKTSVSNLTGERDSIKAERDRLITENAELKKTADSSVLVKENADLKGKLRDLAHRKSFEVVAKAKGASDAALDDLWTLSGYKAEADIADDAAIGALIDAQKTARPYLFGGTTAPPPAALNGAPPLKPGPSSGQGAAVAAAGQLSTDQQSDVKYMMMNFDRIAEDAKGRMNRGEI